MQLFTQTTWYAPLITTGKHLLTLLTTSAWNQAPRPTQPEPALCVGWNEYLAKAGGVNRHIAWHQPVHVVSQCSLMLGWCLASGDQRRLTGSGGTLETWSQRCCIQMAAFTLLYFTGNRKFSLPHLHSTLPLAGLPSEYFITICSGKTRMAWLHDVETILKIRLFVSTEYTNVTDRHHTGWHHTGCLS